MPTYGDLVFALYYHVISSLILCYVATGLLQQLVISLLYPNEARLRWYEHLGSVLLWPLIGGLLLATFFYNLARGYPTLEPIRTGLLLTGLVGTWSLAGYLVKSLLGW